MNNTKYWYNAAIKLNCGTESDGIEKTVACMCTKPFQDILAATKVTGFEEEQRVFGPTVDNKVVFGNYTLRREAGQYVKKPYMIGSNDYESGLFKLLAKSYGVNASDTIFAIINVAFFTCPQARATSSRSSHVPTYRFRYYGDFSNTRLTIDPSSGAWHGAELPAIWRNTPDASGEPDTTTEATISSYLNGAWAAFAKDPTHGLSKAPYVWPRYNAPEKTLIRLAYNNETEATFDYPSTYDLACEVLMQVQQKLQPGFAGIVKASQADLAPLKQFQNSTALGGGSEVGY